MYLLQTEAELKPVQCGSCGVYHAIPKTMYETALEEGGYWHCPNGHQRGFRQGRGEREAVVRERDRLKQLVAQKDDEIAQAKSQQIKAEQALKKVQKRVNAGVCPCCNRTFSNLAVHMKTQHKGYGTANVVPLKTAAPK